MKKRLLLTALFILAACPSLLAQEVYTQGPIWRVELIRVKPGQIGPYLKSLQEVTKPLLDAEKEQHLIVDYKVFLKQTKSSPEDWDVELAVEYKNFASMDDLDAKHDKIRDKITGGGDKTQALIDSRQGMREILSRDLLEEIFLK